MKVVSFGITSWDNQKEAQEKQKELNEWIARINSFLNYPQTFLATGSYSNPKYNPLNIELIQLNLPKTHVYSREWNYFLVAFLAALYHSLLVIKDWDILIHCQTKVFIGENLTKKIEDFYNSPHQIMSPKFTSGGGCLIETGFMALKQDAVRKIITEIDRPCLSNQNKQQENAEETITRLLKSSWYNPFPDILSCRRIDNVSTVLDGHFFLDIENFLKLPIIVSGKHCSETETDLWLEAHPI